MLGSWRIPNNIVHRPCFNVHILSSCMLCVWSKEKCISFPQNDQMQTNLDCYQNRFICCSSTVPLLVCIMLLHDRRMVHISRQTNNIHTRNCLLNVREKVLCFLFYSSLLILYLYILFFTSPCFCMHTHPLFVGWIHSVWMYRTSIHWPPWHGKIFCPPKSDSRATRTRNNWVLSNI